MSLAIGLALLAFSAEAALPHLSSLFADHMVLQREKPVPIWGWAVPGEKISVQFAGQQKDTAAGADGKWTVELAPMSASAEPRKLLVRSLDKSWEVAVDDVLVGEVWLAAGQSNMHWTFAPGHGVLNNEAELATATDTSLRQFTLRKWCPDPLPTPVNAKWRVSTKDNLFGNGLYGDSALAYFFARELRRKLDVPVGILNISMGGASIESFTSLAAQRKVPQLAAMLEDWESRQREFETGKPKESYAQALAKWNTQCEVAKQAGKPAPQKPKEPAEPRRTMNYPGNFFSGSLVSVIPYAIRGALWYQGEQNSRSVEEGALYEKQLPLLIRDWRAHWGYDFPFAWVQLPNYRGGGVNQYGWILVRDGQLKALQVPKTGMAIAVDIGESTNIHPQNKQEAARRLALWALGDVYGQEVAATSGPLPAGHTTEGETMVVSFAHANGGLVVRGAGLKGFEIASADRQWKAATAEIVGLDKVRISHPGVRGPVAVRYAWAGDPDGNLFNGAGLPATPIRTHDWPVGPKK